MDLQATLGAQRRGAMAMKPRHRSQSTTSVNNNNNNNNPGNLAHGQRYFSDHHAHMQSVPMAQAQMTGDGMVLQPNAHLQHAHAAAHNPHPHPRFQVDPVLVSAANHHQQQQQQMAFQQQQQQQQQPQIQSQIPPQNMHFRSNSVPHGLSYQQPYEGSFMEGESHLAEGMNEDQDDVDSVAGSGIVSKKATKSSAANELEMRELYRSNMHRSLPEIAAELHGNERGPQSERQRQVFAMLWISKVCEKGKGSVPRGRVYANYVSRCAKERVTVLNPASFGKLVRVLHPGLKTRRLGQRGESKYHYVGFSIKDDPAMTPPPRSERTQFFQRSVGGESMAAIDPTQSDRARFPAPTMIPLVRPRADGLGRSHSLYKQPEINDVTDVESTTAKYRLRQRFPRPEELVFREGEPIRLPDIAPFLPSGTDADLAKALSALYLSHCTSVVECIRFCKEKTFFHLFTSFHGTLTMPVQKLFAKVEIAPWIEECDFVMYQRMMRVVAPLTLQVAPTPVLDTLRNVSQRLVPHIQNSFQGHPAHVIEAKVAPAAMFVGLLDRELRVNLTAHAAANMLSNPVNRDTMYEDWIKMVRIRKVAEGVPTRAMDEVVNIFLTEMRDLLDPQNVNWETESATLYSSIGSRGNQPSQVNVHAGTSTEDILDRWVTFLSSLQARFPYATPSEIVWCVQRIGTDALRDLTLAQGQSFGAWWVTKCWVDEMISFKAEQGGFMDCKTSRSSRHIESMSQAAPSTRTSDRGSRYSTGSEDFMADGGPDGGLVVSNANSTGNGHGNNRPMDPTSQAALNVAAGMDDSGISMRMPDDDFGGMNKFAFSNDEHDSNVMVRNGMRGQAA